MKTMKTRKFAPASAGPRTRVVALGKLRPLTGEEHQRLREAARDPKLTARRRFPTIKD